MGILEFPKEKWRVMKYTTISKSNINQSWDNTLRLLENDADFDRSSRVLKALSHPMRLKLLCELHVHEKSVFELVSDVDSTQSNVSQHLGILRDKGIISVRKDANKMIYRIADPRILNLIRLIREIFCSQCLH